jgi:myosin heavy subunit
MRSRQAGKGSVQSDFARQLAERNAKKNPQKKARNIVPKGTKLAAGYTDRTKTRTDEEDNEIAKRIKNLEESMKKEEIDRETFEKLVQEITGGDVGTTHLVKGLDRKLLERVRRGEDVLGGQDKKKEEEEAETEEVPEVEDAFDELAEVDVGPITREKVEKKGEKMTSPRPVAGVKRSRNDILKDLKRQREEAAAAAAAEHEKRFPTLGPGFRKINAQGETRIETDEKGREVLIITGPDGKEKRKVKKQKVEEPAPEVRHDLDDATKPINMHNLPAPKKEESEDEDIFEGVGSNYNPLANFDDEDDESDEEVAKAEPSVSKVDAAESQSEGEISSPEAEEDVTAEPKDTVPSAPPAPAKRDYFKSITRDTNTNEASELSAADATVRAALAKVRNLDENSTLLQNLGSSDPNDPASKEARLKKRAAELAASDRDMEDMDMGFGASRFDDAEEMEREGEKVKFSQWKGLGAEGDDEDGEEGAKGPKKQRKRGGKKRKGDKNNADDVLTVMERQKEKKTKTLG